MKITQIRVTRGLTVNTGSFNSVRFDVEMVAEIAATENEEIALVNLTNMVKNELERELFDSGIEERIVLAHVAQLNKST